MYRACIRRRLAVAEVLEVFDEGHAEEVGDFSGALEAVFFVEAHGALERLGGIERDARAASAGQVFFDGVEQELRDAASVPLRRHGHSAQVAFLGRDHSTTDGSDDIATRVERN